MTGSNLASSCLVSRAANATPTWVLGLLLGCSAIGTANAAPEDVERLGKDLTCVGADKSANADGSIPAFSGKWLGVPPHVDFKGTGNHPVDPYPQEKPLFVITAQNIAQYRDASVDAWLAQAQATGDAAIRTELYARVQDQIAEAAPWVPLAHSELVVAARAELQGVVLSPLGHPIYSLIKRGPTR